MLARYDEARAIYRDAADVAQQRSKPHYVWSSNLGIARTYRGAGDVSSAQQVLRSVEAAAAALPADETLHAELSMEQGLLAVEQEDRDVARERLGVALRAYQGSRSNRTARIDILLALAELALRSHDAAEAERLARTALNQAEQLRGDRPHSAWSGRSRLALAHAYMLRGDTATARRLVTSALEDVAPTLGAGHPAAREAEAWLAAHPPV
jgi:ATP/maltotriose-dependent transcriptional regulator MalT